MNFVAAQFVAAPVLVFAYGVLRIVDGLDGERGPGPAWTAGHLAFLGALALFVPVLWRLRRMARPGVTPALSAVAGTVGALALAAQFGIDVVVGWAAADHAHMSDLFDRVRAVPAVTPIVYTAGPYLFYIGLFAVSLLARRGVWLPTLVGANMLLPLIGKDLIPLAALCLLAAFWPLRHTPAATPAQPGVPAPTP